MTEAISNTSRRRRIAMFIHHEVGGAVTAFYDFMKILRAHDYEIDLYRFNQAGETFLPLSQSANHVFDYSLALNPRVARRLPFLREYVNTYRYWRNLKRIDQASARMAQEIDARAYDFVFVHCDQIVKNPHLLKYLTTPTYAYIHEPERIFFDPPALFSDELDRLPNAKSTMTRVYARWYAPARHLYMHLWRRESRQNIISHPQPLLTNSYFSAEAFLRAYDVNARVCYLGIDSAIFYPRGLERQNFVLTVGSLTPNKGHAFIVRALAQISQPLRPTLVAVVDVAQPQRRDNLSALAAQLGVKVEIRERISQSELVSLYNSAKLFVYGSRLEPFGLAPLEAMACGLPVVAIRSGGVRETVVDGVTGLLADWDVNDFASKINRLLDDSMLWNTMSRQGPPYVQAQWNWERTYQRFEKLVRCSNAELQNLAEP